MNTSTNTQNIQGRLLRIVLLSATALLTAVLSSHCGNTEIPYDEILRPADDSSSPGNPLEPIAYAPGGIYLWLSDCYVDGAMNGAMVMFDTTPACSDTGFTGLTEVAKANRYCQELYSTEIPAADQTRIAAEHAAAGTTPQHRAVLINSTDQNGVYEYNFNGLPGIPWEARDYGQPESLVGVADLRQVKHPDETVIADHWFSFFHPDFNVSAAIRSSITSSTANAYWASYTDIGGASERGFASLALDANLCNGWTSNANANRGVRGDASSIGLRRMAAGPTLPIGETSTCDLGRHILCVTY